MNRILLKFKEAVLYMFMSWLRLGFPSPPDPGTGNITEKQKFFWGKLDFQIRGHHYIKLVLRYVM